MSHYGGMVDALSLKTNSVIEFEFKSQQWEFLKNGLGGEKGITTGSCPEVSSSNLDPGTYYLYLRIISDWAYKITLSS